MEILASQGVEAVVCDMCRFGMVSKDPQGQVNPVLKPTRFMTNSSCIMMELDKRCTKDHDHTQLVGGWASAGWAPDGARICDFLPRA